MALRLNQYVSELLLFFSLYRLLSIHLFVFSLCLLCTLFKFLIAIIDYTFSADSIIRNLISFGLLMNLSLRTPTNFLLEFLHICVNWLARACDGRDLFIRTRLPWLSRASLFTSVNFAVTFRSHVISRMRLHFIQVVYCRGLLELGKQDCII